ncbi:MAG: hypothetical protein WAR41_00275 [Azonexus sp.]
MGTVGNGLPQAGSPRAAIALIGELWDIECGHLLGEISRGEHQRAVKALRDRHENSSTIVRTKGKIDE